MHSCASCALFVLQHWRLLWLNTTAAAVDVLIAFFGPSGVHRTTSGTRYSFGTLGRHAAGAGGDGTAPRRGDAHRAAASVQGGCAAHVLPGRHFLMVLALGEMCSKLWPNVISCWVLSIFVCMWGTAESSARLLSYLRDVDHTVLLSLSLAALWTDRLEGQGQVHP